MTMDHHRTRTAAITGLLLLAALSANAQPIIPHGWSGYKSETGMYLQRPDLPGVRVHLYGDARPDLDLPAVFETFKQQLAARHQCPGLESAETVPGFGSLGARSPGEYPKCELIAMGLPNGGMQVGLVVDAKDQLKSNQKVREAVRLDIVQLFMTSAGMMQTGKQPRLTAEAYATLIPIENKPIRMIHYTSPIHDATVVAARAITGSEITAAPIGQNHHALLLFSSVGDDQPGWASGCSDWDPAFYSPDTILPYHAANQCFPVRWRWKDGVTDGPVEVKPAGKEWMPATDYFALNGRPDRVRNDRPFRKFQRGERFDLKIGQDRELLDKVAAGELRRSALGKWDIILSPNGRFTAGDIKSAILGNTWTSCQGITCTSADPAPATGSYYFDEYTVTLKLDSGKVVHGFAAWLASDKGEQSMGNSSNLVINGVLYRSIRCVDPGTFCFFQR